MRKPVWVWLFTLTVSLAHVRFCWWVSVVPVLQLNDSFSLFTFSVMVATPMLFTDGRPTMRSLWPKPTPSESLRSPPATRPTKFTIVESWKL